MMDSLGIPKRKKVKNKYYDLSLHGRIELFAKNEPVLGAQLMALKRVGNSGSHDSVSKDDLLDAFEILQHVLEEIINDRSAKVAELAKKLTKKHRGRT